jgi:hypothetical protein
VERSPLRFRVGITVALTFAGALATGASPASAYTFGSAAFAAPVNASHAPSMSITSNVSDIALKASIDHHDGSMTAKWSAPTGESVTVTGRFGAKVNLTERTTSTSGKELFVEVTTPEIDKTNTAAVNAMMDAYKTGKRSVEKDATNTGIDAAQVSDVGVASIYDSWCVDVSLNSGAAKEHFCDIRTKVQDNGGGDWYMGDEMTGTTSWHSGQALFSSYGGDAYSSGNTMVKWNPAGTINPGSCSSNTQQVTYNGFSISSTSTVCPDRIDPYTNNLGGAGIEEFWHGCSAGSVGLNPVDVVHSPPSASVSATLKGYIHTEWTC